MASINHRRRVRRALALAAGVAIAGPGAGGAAVAAEHDGGTRLVVRGEDTVRDGPCPGGVCPIELTDGTFRGTPVGTGAYAGRVALRVADAFPNGEGGVCAPIEGELTLGVGSPDRLVLALSGDSCQDGAGDVKASAFTGLARFTVRGGTGRYAGARGGGIASFAEDAADRERMTLVGWVRG